MALTTLTVHGEILDPDGLTPAVGTVTFKNRVELRDTVDNIIYEPATWIATLDVSGEFTIVLPTTDNPDITPLDWTYQVYVSTTGWREAFNIELPAALGPVVEFADLIPLDDPDTCTPDGTACAPISLVGEVTALADEVADLAADLDTAEITIGALVGQVNTISPIVFANQTAITILQGQITNIDAAWITTGTLAYQRLGGTIAENNTVTFNRATLVNPGTAADTWSFSYNGTRVTYVNEYACLRVRGIPDNQVPARFMSHFTRDGSTTPTFQVSLSDATTHLFQVLANGDILAPGSLSMLPSAATAVTFVGTVGNAALISDGAAGTGAPYPVTTTYIPSNNRVWMDGSFANTGGVAIGAQTTLMTVAAAHRPTAWVQFPGRTSTNLAVRITIKGATGALCIDQSLAAGATLALDGANYRKS